LIQTNQKEKKMAQSVPTLSRHDLEAKIVKRCWEDEAFRKEFTADPAGAFVKYLEVPKDSLPKIVVHEEEPGSWHIVLLPRPANVGELSEEDMETIAGGTSAAGIATGLQRLIDSVAMVTATVSAAGVSGVGSLIAGQNVDTGW
jgi:hypothetical protein